MTTNQRPAPLSFLSLLSFCLLFMTRRPAPAAFLSGGEDDSSPHTFTFTSTSRRLEQIQSPFIPLRLKRHDEGRKEEVKASSGGFCSRRLKGRKQEKRKKTEAIVFLLSANSHGFLLMHSRDSFNCLSLHSNSVCSFLMSLSFLTCN